MAICGKILASTPKRLLVKSPEPGVTNQNASCVAITVCNYEFAKIISTKSNHDRVSCFNFNIIYDDFEISGRSYYASSRYFEQKT